MIGRIAVGRFRTTLFTAFAATLVVGTFTTASGLGATRPNIVVIQTDDQNPRLMKSSYRGGDGVIRKTMPNTLGQIVGAGTEFRNYYATSPVCSPSRASLLTGQYPHNNGLVANEGAFGGWKGWQALPIARQNLPLALNRSGYRTSHFGKFTNSYYNPLTGGASSDVPPGWDRWFTTSFRSGENRFYGYTVSDDSRPRGPYGDPDYRSRGPSIDPPSCTAATAVVSPDGAEGRPVRCDYITDVMTRKAVAEIERDPGRPLYLQVDYESPHGDIRPPEGPQPATRHIGSADLTPMPESGNFNEADLTDKPDRIQDAAAEPLEADDLDLLRTAYRRQLEGLRSIDDGVGEIIDALRRTGKLEDTYIFFTSDHGFFLGEHRLFLAKFLPFEEASTVSMAVRGPGVAEGVKSDEVVGNIDVPATVFQLAGVKANYRIDGRSLVPYWRDANLTSRRPVGISLLEPTFDAGRQLEKATPTWPRKMLGPIVLRELTRSNRTNGAPPLRYTGFRVGPYKLIRYRSGESELYDLERDPDELLNVYGDPAYRAVRTYMDSHLARVDECAGSQCREELPPWPSPDTPAEQVSG